MSLDLDSLAPVALWRCECAGPVTWIPDGTDEDLTEDTRYVAIPRDQYQSLVAELRAAREKIASLPAPVAVEAVAKVSVAGRLEGSIEAHVRACHVLLADEQEKIAPDNALISALCDSVRLAREYVEYVKAKHAAPVEPTR